AGTCRRGALLGYFGERLAEGCGNCDLCLDPPESFDATEDARKALSCVYRVGQRFGAGHVIDVLRGSKSERIQQLGHDRLSTYGIGADRSAEAWGSIIRQLIHRGYLEQDLANYSVLKLTPAARPLLRGEESLVLAKPRVKVTPVKKEPKRKGVAASLAEGDEGLFQALRVLRKRLADEQQVPPYVIFSDATLVEMAALRPATMDDLLRVNGVGQQKLGRYGAAFLEVIQDLERFSPI
ncbi:ATP-dependent DNA helicase RecQ, partial [bacterium]|nr:ATP-dependent DNA helicase RecQ [bacterium]